MTIQQWCFSWRGRLTRRDFWLWLAVWWLLMLILFTLAGQGWLETRFTAFCVVALLWPTAAVMVKRLHDRNKKGGWALLLVLAFILASGNWHGVLPPLWGWAIGRFMPILIMVMLVLDLGVFAGTPGENRFGPEARPLRFWRVTSHQ
ncbi:DUF805 domain-containing protein [Pantoea sp. 1.19]|uniref:DUF805 domain-containing protein n=1 Tax=Pantoea sp. 1.19 TaxID=1925589 RepID=UPI000948DB25|nr:DUF805 domain-containing protein [Pantoea sp. 1.19]